MADHHTRSPGAVAVADLAAQLGLGAVRLAVTTPCLSYVVNAPSAASAEALAAYASVVMETSVHVLSLEALPVWRRDKLWGLAPPVARTAARIRPSY